ncbi:nucleoid-associated protein [Yersinia alsatica]|uniref:nucleoid-associated protein n=1 Tax=Yersinia alsatica TaxID=2890317 RepID=UPI0011A19A7A|nr:nucleoid-associated protein [Yersinia alsatica]
MAFLTENEILNLRITNMILHVVGVNEFSAEPARIVEHEQFFIARILDTDISPIYSFNENSDTKSQLESIVNGDDSFESISQSLSQKFSQEHAGNSRDGAFFIFELVNSEENCKIYSLIKYDYNEAIEQSDSASGSLLRRIVHAFIADKKAIQKSALIRIVNGIADLSISTKDRMKRAPEISDYFAKFLGVTRTLSDRELNIKTKNVLQDTLSDCKEMISNGNVPAAFRRSIGIVRDRQEINEETIFDAIIMAVGNPDNEEVQAKIRQVANRKIRAAKLEGLVFRTDLEVLGRPPLRKVKTTEGITITYPDDAEGSSIIRTPNVDGGESITIQTERVTEDCLVRDISR